MIIKNTRYLILAVFVFLFSLNFIFAATNTTSIDEARGCLNDSYKTLNLMTADGFNTLRINDSIKQGQLFFDSQVVLYQKNLKYDFSPVIPYCNEVKTARQNAVIARDELDALLVFYNASVVPGMNTSSIDSIISEIRSEISNERYENVKPLVDSAYNEIISVKSSYTALNVFMSSTTRNLKTFFLNNWKIILSLIVILSILFFAYKTRISKWLLERQINALELRKSTIKNLIMKTQKDYFEVGKVSESEYNIKIKKFAELIRDIERQIPLLKEELLKLEGRKIKKI